MGWHKKYIRDFGLEWRFFRVTSLCMPNLMYTQYGISADVVRKFTKTIYQSKMKNKNKIKGDGSTNTIVQTEKGDIKIGKIVNQSNEQTNVPTKKVTTIETGITSSIAMLIATIALLADFLTMILNFGQLFNLSGVIRNGLLITLILVAVFSMFIILISTELKRKGFSGLLPGTQFASDYVFTTSTDNKILLVKLKMTCPRCFSQMTIGYKEDGYYRICKRNNDHNLKFDYTTLDNLK